jgi:hypothetical protein
VWRHVSEGKISILNHWSLSQARFVLSETLPAPRMSICSELRTYCCFLSRWKILYKIMTCFVIIWLVRYGCLEIYVNLWLSFFHRGDLSRRVLRYLSHTRASMVLHCHCAPKVCIDVKTIYSKPKHYKIPLGTKWVGKQIPASLPRCDKTRSNRAT